MTARGIERERKVRALLEGEDWWTARSAGSLGSVDVVALRAGSRPRLCEVKSSARSPFAHFPPNARAELLLAARIAGAEPWLVWWPPRARQPLWIPESEWPS